MTDVLSRTELLVLGPAEALSGLLSVPMPDLAGGEGLPLLWHWIYLLERPAQIDLGIDGHPIRNTIPEPPGQGRRRMWAGGRVRTREPLHCGEEATKQTKVLSTKEKHGRTGSLTFVVVEHRISQRGRVVIEERQDIVYRDAPPAGQSASPPTEPTAEAAAEPGEWSIEVSPTLLMRFSALTYNAHRIHYDREYACEVEGYPGLLTHGPLQAIAMAEAARAQGIGGACDFEYRLVSPLFDHQGILVKASSGAESTTTQVRDRYGRVTATATLRNMQSYLEATGVGGRP